MMSDTQVVTIVIAILASLGALFCDNSRISDLRSDNHQRFAGLSKRIDDLRADSNQRFAELSKRIDDLRADVTRHIDDKYTLLDAKLDRILDLIGDHESRIQKLEGK